MSRCKHHSDEAIFRNMCLSCVEGYIENLEDEAVKAKKCNSCMSRQIDKLTNEPLSCNGTEDGKCDQDWRDNGCIEKLEERIADLEQAFRHCKAVTARLKHDPVHYGQSEALCDYIDEVLGGKVKSAPKNPVSGCSLKLHPVKGSEVCVCSWPSLGVAYSDGDCQRCGKPMQEKGGE